MRKNLVNACIGLAVLCSACASSNLQLATNRTEVPEAWHLADPEQDSIGGTSVVKAYQTLLAGKKPQREVVVAVIDSGIDIEHEDLKDNIWTNTDEVAGNGKDDDGNGYIDDVHGWNFIGDVSVDTYEMTRIYGQLAPKYEGKTLAEVDNKEEFKLFKKVELAFNEERNQYEEQAKQFMPFYMQFERATEILQDTLGQEFTAQQLEVFEPKTQDQTTAKGIYSYAIANGFSPKEIVEYKDYLAEKLEYQLNPDFDSRSLVGDNYSNLQEKSYGNNEYEGADARHGTHVAGIIAATRNNNIGIDGIAPAKIMVLRAVPNGDERDKDIANAIRYAVDNGAHVINMSFGKAYSPQKQAVDDAVRYATQKGALLIHAAGNESLNTDVEDNFPTRAYLTGSDEPLWLEIGASGWGAGPAFVAEFSNYGRKNVDLFAPGVDIYSTVPDSKYEDLSGTSMAAPVVSGVAALIMAYYPNLTGQQVKEILIKSSIRPKKLEVSKPGEDPASAEAAVQFKDLSRTGGLVNAYKALQLAEKKK